jgi:NAD(P)-dependent dehydrogenase (short-subunit alcohol dehydrogenase family)
MNPDAEASSAWLEYAPRAQSFTDRIVLVTGSTAGIGEAVARALGALGATVILHGRSERKLEALHEELTADGIDSFCAQLDLSRAQGDDYQQLVDSIEERFGRLDGLLHNASILGDRSPIEHHDSGVWQRVIHVNLTAPFILTRCLLPLLNASAMPAIVFTTSTVGHIPKAYWGAYSVSKFGLEGLARMLAIELEQTAIRVNLVNPGATRTSMRRQAYPAEDAQTLRTADSIIGPYLYLLGTDGRALHGARLDCQA